MNMAIVTNRAKSPINVAANDEPAVQKTANPMVAFEGVSKRFAAGRTSAEVVALANIDLVVPRGSVTGIIGRSGAGKSTLIRLVNGLEKPSSGHVLVDGVDVAGLDEKSLRAVRRSIGMIFQHFNLLSSRTAFDNIALPLEIAGVDKQSIEKRVTPLLELVGLSDKRDRYPAELSGGQKQRIGIARALATEPKLLLSDEATSALDPETTRSILALLKQINRELGLTVLLITHEMEVVKTIADHVAVIDGGRIVEQGPTFDVFTGHIHETTRALLGGLAGMRLPEFLTSRISERPEAGSRTILRVVFKGENATEPMLARLGSDLGIEVNILAGAVDEIAGRPFGMLVVSLRADEVKIVEARQFLADHGLSSEVVGYVR
ncbi:methionine ABC transporter ATP-binding protein [Phyllobacterium sophorae]|jgi:D-methionine transport system ATP-binding protein|uniref:Cell division ATP-binding protein FtsE n=2 Tax=Phyllobacteriaceae TaxID=69277 RepID=A0A2P7BH32_9HYPH|nr:methionine ABC transporter ATP-binding protein [Phyllobacterium sophorae]